MFLYVTFEHLEKAVRDRVGRSFSHVVLKRQDVEIVISSARAAHPSIHGKGADLAANLLGSCEDSRVVIEERHKMMDAPPLGLLVADKAYQIRLATPFHLQYAPVRLFHLYVLTTILGTYLVEEAIIALL